MEQAAYACPDGVTLELRHHAGPGSARRVLVIKGLGGCAGEDGLVRALQSRFVVTTVSPRGAGGSGGSFTLAQHLADLEGLLSHVAQQDGAPPLVVGHSLGAWALGVLLGRQPLAQRAVLLAPLLNILEQTPVWFVNHITAAVKQDRIPTAVRVAAFAYSSFVSPPSGQRRAGRLAVDQQRFDPPDVLPFLRGLLNAPLVEAPLRVPTQVLLAGKANTGLRLRNLDQLATAWRERVGPAGEVETHGHLDHFMALGGPFFESRHTEQLTQRMLAFLHG